MRPADYISSGLAAIAIVISLVALWNSHRSANAAARSAAASERSAEAAARQTALNEAAAANAAEQERIRQRDAELEYARRLYAIALPLELALQSLGSSENTQNWGGILSIDAWRAFETAATAVGKLPFAAELKGELDAAGNFFGPFRVDPSNRSQVLVGLNAITQRIRPELRVRGGEAPFPSAGDVVARFTRS